MRSRRSRVASVLSPMDGSAGPVLALDLGDVRIGVAISDPQRRIAVPVGTVHVGRPPGEMRAVAEIAADRQATLIVVGEPVSLDGTRGARAAHAESFADALRTFVHVPVVLHDERLSTVEAERALRAAGVTGSRQRRVVDASAAQVILQAWLDAQRGTSRRD
jgi:putative pre-16S rRNA nuclease